MFFMYHWVFSQLTLHNIRSIMHFIKSPLTKGKMKRRN